MRLGHFFAWGLVLFIALIAGCASGEAVVSEPEPLVSDPPRSAAAVRAPAEPAVPRNEPIKPQSAAEPEPEADAVPVIWFEESVHDFGQVGPSSSHTVDFKFENKGSEVLKIERFHAPCGCTIPELKKREYEPGESGMLNVRYNAASSGVTDVKPIYVYTNDPKNPQYELTIKAKVVVNVEISPKEVSLLLDQDNAGMPKLSVTSTDGKAFAITSASATNGVMTIPFDRSERATEFILDPKVDMEKLGTTPTGLIQVRTDHPQAGLLAVHFSAKPFFEVSRPRIILQNIAPGEEIIRDVWIRSNYDQKVEIESYSSTNGMMSIDSQRHDGNHLQIMVKITPSADAPTPTRRYISDELKIKLTSGQELSIRCNAWFRLN